MINPANKWDVEAVPPSPTDVSYEHLLKETFKKASEMLPDGVTPKYDEDGMFTLSKEMWGTWIYENVKAIQCVAPITPPVTLSGTTPTASGFAPDFKGKENVTAVATELASQFQSFASSIAWVPPPPAPPFSAITSVVMNAGSVSAAYSTLLSGLLTELVTPTVAGSESTKYTALATLFRTAFTSLTVDFIGIAQAGSPPPPLTIPAQPVF